MIVLTYDRPSACECGASTLLDDLPLGTEYLADPFNTIKKKWECARCHRKHHDLWIAVIRRDKPNDTPGYLPVKIFKRKWVDPFRAFRLNK